MKWRATAIWILAIALPLAIELTVKPSDALSIVLFAIVGIALTTLILSLLWNWGWAWERVARQVYPHLPVPSPVKAAGVSEDPAPRAAIGASGPTDEQLAAAIDDLLDELATIDSRLAEAIDNEFYGYKFFLPSSEYHKHKAAISTRSGKARAVLSEVYIQTDALNGRMPGPTADGIEMALVDSPDPVRLREIVSRAQATLRQLRP